MKLRIYLNRIERIRSFFKIWKVEAVLIENEVDLFYFTGFQLSAGVLLILKEDVKLFVDGRYFEFVKLRNDFFVDQLSVKAIKKSLKSVSTLGFDSGTTTIERWKELKAIHHNLSPINRLTKLIRAIKDSFELVALNKSEALLFEGFRYVRKQLRVGIEERGLALAFETFCRQRGAEKLAFSPIIAFGKNSAYPHYQTGKSRLKKNDIILCDLGVVVDHYHSDTTRTFFYGKGNPRLEKLDRVVKEAQEAAIEQCREGALTGDLDKAATKMIKKAELEKYIAHSLGHGIGLEIHEFPRLSSKKEDRDVVLREGMVITIEPGLYIPGLGGVRQEDRVVVTKTGCLRQKWKF